MKFVRTLFAAYIICIMGGLLAFGYIYANEPEPTFLEFINQTSYHIKIYDTTTHDRLMGSGSATHLYKNIFLSARHVCDEATPGVMELVQHDKKAFAVKETIITDSASNDLCLLRTEEEATTPTTKLANPDTFSALGERAFIGGYSGGRFYSVRTGYIYLEGMVQIMDKAGPIPMRLQFLSVIGEPGISGAGVFNKERELVGVAVAVGPQGLGIMPLKAIVAFLKAHKVVP